MNHIFDSCLGTEMKNGVGDTECGKMNKGGVVLGPVEFGKREEDVQRTTHGYKALYWRIRGKKGDCATDAVTKSADEAGQDWTVGTAAASVLRGRSAWA